ncbi:MAG: hypothetical protein KC486_30705, partial [Myxococcales bacterium]|nr:hypothetical protein [Myxococcales bacterium]
LAGVDPDKLNAVLTELAEAGGLGELITTLANDSINLLDELAGAELGAAAELVKAMSGGADFLAKLEDVGRRGAELSGVLATFDPTLGLTAVARSDGATARDVLARVSALIVAVDALLETEVANDLGDLARRLGIGGPLAAGFTELIEALELADAWLSKLKDPLNEVNDAAALFGGLLNVLATLGRVLAEPAFADANPDNAGLNAVNDVAASLSLITGGLPRYAEEVAPVRDALSGTISTAQTLQSQIGGSP